MALVVWHTADWRSYVSVADADTYMALRLGNALWLAATTGTKESALATATGLLVTVLDTTMQAQWITDDVLPTPIKIATYELALALLKSPALADLSGTGKNISSLKAGTAAISYFHATEGSLFPLLIMRLIAPYRDASVSEVATGSEVFGNEDCTSFPWWRDGLSRGL